MTEPVRSNVESLEPRSAATVKTDGATKDAASGQVRPRPKRISNTPPAPPPAPTLDDYEPIIGKSQLDELRFLPSIFRARGEDGQLHRCRRGSRRNAQSVGAAAVLNWKYPTHGKS